METGYKYIIKIGRFFIAKYLENNKIFVGWINKNKSYKVIFE
jgi:hypothetical protein